MKRPTIADIAQRAGLSKGAVSYALNGRPGVSEETRRRVHEIAAELGWRPNSAARALSAARASAVGLLLARPAVTLSVEPFFMQLVAGIQSVLAEHSVGLMFQVVPDIETEMRELRDWAGERRVDGVLLSDLRVDDPRVPLLEALRLPAAVIGGPAGHGSLPAVWSDDAAAMRAVVDYLVALGHRRVARVGGMVEFLHTKIRTDAFRSAATDRGLNLASVANTDYTGERGAAATRRLLSTTERPTALVYDNDVMAVAGLSVAREMGLAVPGDLSLVAWDDSPLCRLVHPPLTAVSRDIPGYGASAARVLLAAVGGESVSDHQDPTPTLVPRGSTAPPAA